MIIKKNNKYKIVNVLPKNIQRNKDDFKRNNLLTIMPDYCSSGLWINGGGMIDLINLPKKTHKLKNKLNIFNDTFENLMKLPLSKVYWLDKDELTEEEYIKRKQTLDEHYNSEKFNKFIALGYEISKEFKHLLPKWDIIYFDIQKLHFSQDDEYLETLYTCDDIYENELLKECEKKWKILIN